MENKVNRLKHALVALGRSAVSAVAALGLLVSFSIFASSNSYEGARYATTEGKVYYHLSGEYSLAASTASWSTYTITMNGDGGLITASSVTLTGRLTADSLAVSNIRSLVMVSSAMTFASPATFTSSATFMTDISMGWERVSNNCGNVSTCTATCSSGRYVMGGGCLSSNTELIMAYPGTDISFTCALTGNVPNTAYAICVRAKP